MCVSMGPVEFSKTIHGICEVNFGGQLRHAAFYQNTIEQVARRATAPAPQPFLRPSAVPSGRRRPAWASQQGGPANWQTEEPATGNALIIPLLGAYDTIKLIDLSCNKSALKDVATAVTPRGRGMMRGDDFLSFGAVAKGAVQSFDYDIYRIVIAECASDIPNAVRSVPGHKRPQAVPEIFEAFEAGYDSPIAVCCFAAEDAGEAAPVGFHYEPFNPNHLFLYTLDGHDGKAPNYNARVKLDHTLFVGSYQMQGGTEVDYTDPVSAALRDLLPQRVLGRPFDSTHLNGDVVFDVKDVRKGIFNGLRALPPGVPAQAGRAREFLTLG